MPALVLNLLGGFEAVLEGGPAVPLSTKTGQALLAYLALPPDRRHSRDKLAGLLWEDRPDEQARTSLRQTLAVLRKSLPSEPAFLRTEGDWIALDPEACAIDVTAFEQLSAGDDPAALGRAAALYKGELLDGFHLRSEAFPVGSAANASGCTSAPCRRSAPCCHFRRSSATGPRRSRLPAGC
jgi:DNA-binding SARP family transcriptional activator